MKIYVAGAWSNRARVRDVQQALREDGHEITHDWTSTPEEAAATPEGCRAIAIADLAGVAACDLLVALLPGGLGTHIEIGAQIGAGGAALLLCSEDAPASPLYEHPQIGIVETLADARTLIRRLGALADAAWPAAPRLSGRSA